MKSRNKELLSGVVLIWFGLGFNAVLSALKFHWLVCQIVLIVFFAVWASTNLDRSRFLRRFFFTLVEIFFRNFDVAGKARIPLEGGVIFACAPHANQFVDGLVVMRAVSPRKLGFLVAAKTMRRKYVGAMARALGGISVERAQDVAILGKGKIHKLNDTTLSGIGTQFTRDVRPRDTVVIYMSKADGSRSNAVLAKLRVVTVKNDTELEVKTPSKDVNIKSINESQHLFKVFPHIDQSEVFRNVCDKLVKGHAVGIFPEGGSHDRTSLLPLKAGVSIMALSATCQSGTPITVIPVGINYFKGHRFRSRVFVDIGVPIKPTREMIEGYTAGGQRKRNACNKLLDQIMKGLRGVTIQSPDFDTLQSLRMMRRLYSPSNEIMNAAERFALMHAFSQGYEREKNNPNVKALRAHIDSYRQLLIQHQVSDHRVATARKAEDIVDAVGASLELVYRLAQCLGFLLVAGPGLVLAAPVFALTRSISKRKARQAKAKSSVKIKGQDVIATWKVLVSLIVIPCAHIIYTCLFYFIFGMIFATAYFWFSPFICFLAVIAVERGKRIGSMIIPLFMCALKLDSGSNLYDARQKLKLEVRGVIEELSWDSVLKDDTVGKSLYRSYSKDLNKLGDVEEEEDDLPEQWFLSEEHSPSLSKKTD